MNQTYRAPVRELPSTQAELLAMRKAMREPTLNDHIDDLHVILWNDPSYRRALDSVYDEDALEGSLSADNFVAATKLRDYAVAHNNAHVEHRKLATIVKSLAVVLRRYGITRKERSLTLGDEIQNSGE